MSAIVRVLPGWVLGPILDARRGIDTNYAALADADLAELPGNAAGLAHHVDEALAVRFAPHCRAAADRRPHRRNNRTDFQILRRNLVGKPFDLVLRGVDAGVRFGKEKVHAFKLDAANIRRRGQIQHFVETDRRLQVRPLADEARPHCVVQLRKIVASVHGVLLPLAMSSV